HILRLVRDPLHAIGVVLARAHEAQVATVEILQGPHHVGDVDEILGLVQNDDDTHRSDDPNAECGMRNAELQGKVVRVTTLALTFRIPHCEFRILVIRPTPAHPSVLHPAGRPARTPTRCRRSKPAARRDGCGPAASRSRADRTGTARRRARAAPPLPAPGARAPRRTRGPPGSTRP